MENVCEIGYSREFELLKYTFQETDKDVGFRLKSKLDIIAPYKFVMAFENSVARDYVTEKIFGGLAVGTVPSKKVFLTVYFKSRNSWI